MSRGSIKAIVYATSQSIYTSHKASLFLFWASVRPSAVKGDTYYNTSVALTSRVNARPRKRLRQNSKEVIMSLHGDDTENLSPKAAAFSIASLLTKDLHENSNTVKARQLSPSSANHKEKGKHRTGCQEDISAPMTKLSAVSKEVCEDYSIQNILNAEHSRGDKCADGIKRGVERSGSILDPLQKFSACCDLVSNLDSLKNSSSFCVPQMRLLDVQREVQVAMQQSDLWWKFYACGTEMVITRTGRWEKLCS